MSTLRVIPRWMKDWKDADRAPGLYENNTYRKRLPATEFFEGDWLVTPLGLVLQVSSIDYHLQGTSTPDYVLKDYELGVYTYPESKLKLSRRGPVWKYFHKQKLVFGNLYEEAQFHVRMRWATRAIRISGAHEFLTWDLGQLLPRLKTGRTGHIDWFCFNRAHTFYHAYRLKDTKLGKRCREYLLRTYDEGRLGQVIT